MRKAFAMFDRIGGILGAAFYAAQGLALGPAVVLYLAGAEAAARAWLAWTLPPMIALALALVFGLPAVGVAMTMWRLMTDREYGSG